MIYIGTSGYYIHKDKYNKLFNSVEINYTYYRTPSRKTWINWYNEVGDNFRYSVKVNRFITHSKKLAYIDKSWKRFWNGCKLLKEKLGCILFQFSENFQNTTKKSNIDGKTNFERLQDLAKIVDKNVKCVFEFRDKSWFTMEVYNLMKKNNWSIVIVHLNNIDNWADDLDNGFNPKLNSWIKTSDYVYFRLHGTKGKYIGSYSDHILKKIRKFIKKNKFKNSYIYFNNTDGEINGIQSATYDAHKMLKIIK